MSERMIILDCEATNLVLPALAPDDQQPHLVEVTLLPVAVKTLKPLGKSVTLRCRPPVPLPGEFTKITGIVQEEVEGLPPFAAILPALTEVMLGTRYLLAHNVAYDAGVLALELQRLGRVAQFPWPPERCCTVEATQHFTGQYLSLQNLALHLFGQKPEQAHRSQSDVELLHRCCLELKKQGHFPWGG